MDGNDERRLWLSRQLGAPVSLVWTDNRSVMISVKGNAAAGYHLRIQQLFRQAPGAVWRALVAHVRGTNAGASAILRQYVRDHQHLLKPANRRRAPARVLQSRGRYFDLEAIYQALNRDHFDDRVQARITWGRQPSRRPRRSIRFGGLQSQGAPDPHPSLAGPGVRAAVCGRKRRVPRNAAPTPPAATHQWPLVDPHPGVSPRRTPIPAFRASRGVAAPASGAPAARLRLPSRATVGAFLNFVVFQQQLITPPLGGPSLRLTPVPPAVRLFPGPASTAPQRLEFGFQLLETGFGSFASRLFFTTSGLFFSQAA